MLDLPFCFVFSNAHHKMSTYINCYQILLKLERNIYFLLFFFIFFTVFGAKTLLLFLYSFTRFRVKWHLHVKHVLCQRFVQRSETKFRHWPLRLNKKERNKRIDVVLDSFVGLKAKYLFWYFSTSNTYCDLKISTSLHLWWR